MQFDGLSSYEFELPITGRKIDQGEKNATGVETHRTSYIAHPQNVHTGTGQQPKKVPRSASYGDAVVAAAAAVVAGSAVVPSSGAVVASSPARDSMDGYCSTHSASPWLWTAGSC